jgi:hypothetical protein
MVWAVVGALVVCSCGERAEPEPPPAIVRGPRFEEAPQLEALVSDEAWFFEQETWTSPSLQHCWEWGFPEARREQVVADLRAAAVGRLGWTDVDLSETVRRDGAVISITRGFLLDPLDPRSTLLKVVVCTEGRATTAARDRFLQELARQPLWARRPVATPPHVGWLRHLSGGTRAVGAHWREIDVEGTARRLREAGWVERERLPLVIELRKGRERARFLGSGLWWQIDDQP